MRGSLSYPRWAWPCAALTLAFAPLDAHANVFIGWFLNSIPALLLMVLPAIVIEAPILARVLNVPGRRALWLSVRANAYSLIIGGLLSLLLDFAMLPTHGSLGGRDAAAVAMFVMFFLTWGLERRSLRVALGTPEGTVRAAFFANLASYAALYIALHPERVGELPPAARGIPGATGRCAGTRSLFVVDRARRTRHLHRGRAGAARAPRRPRSLRAGGRGGRVVRWHCDPPPVPPRYRTLFGGVCRPH